MIPLMITLTRGMGVSVAEITKAIADERTLKPLKAISGKDVAIAWKINNEVTLVLLAATECC